MKPFKIPCPGAQLFALITLLAATNAYSQCVPSNVNHCSSFSNNTSIGTYAWSNPAGAQANDFSYANMGVLLGLFANINTNYLVAEGPGFNIPSYATICGIEVDVDESAVGIVLGTKVSDHSVRIVKGNTISGTEHASGAAWTLGGGYATYGSATDLWGLNWLPSDVNSAGFGIAISTNVSFGLASLLLTANIDDIKITVYYDSSTLLTSSSIKLAAMKAPGRVNLQWSDLTGSLSSYFIVEKSADSRVWTAIDSVPAAETNSSGGSYHSSDPYPGPQNYYRLRQTDMKGMQQLSGIVSVEYTNTTKDGLDIFPNPAHGQTRVAPLDKTTAIRDIKVIDLFGRPVPVPLSVAGTAFELNITHLPPGIYLVQALIQNKITSSRLIVR
ncbi:MAG TPA: T9SS type A sorting domain-containing protein [Chitinophagaceae bacterium]|jgi:hypothetical protein